LDHQYGNIKQALDRLQPHDHLCIIYETDDEWRDTLVPYLAIGLERGEKCAYIADCHTEDEIRQYLGEAGIDVAAVESSGQLVIMHETEAYTRSGHFDPDKMIEFLSQIAEATLSEGYSCLRATGEMTWVFRSHPGSEKLLEYESKLNRDFFQKYPVIGLCQYDRRRFDPEVIEGVILTHPLLARGEHIYDNFYYMPTDDYLGENRRERQIQAWLDNLERERKNTAERQRTQEELLQAKQEWERTFDAVPDLIAILDDEHRIVRVNRAMAQRLGVLPWQCQGLFCFQCVHGLEGPPSFCPHTLTLADGKEHVKEVHESHLCGDFLVSTTPLYDQQGKVIGAVHVARDITERKRVEEKLLQTASELQTVFRALPDLYFRLRADGTFLDVQAGRLSDLHQPIGKLIGRRIQDVSKSLGEKFQQAIDQVLETQSLVMIEYGLTIGGEKRLFEARFLPLFEDQVIVVVRNITVRKQVEQALREANAYLENLINYANAPIIVWDPGFQITRFNRAFEKLTGLKAEEVLGRSLEILFPEARKEESMALIRRTTSGERWEVVEIPIAHVGGTIRTVLWNSATLFAADGMTVIATIAQGQDITERKQLEDELREHRDHLEELVTERTNELKAANERLQTEIAERKRIEEELRKLNIDLHRRAEELADTNRELESFSYSVSHDLRAPLRSINGFSRIICDQYQDRLDAEGREYLQIITSECKRMGELIDALLNLSRLSRKEISREEVDLSSMAEAMAADLHRREPGRQVDFVIASGVRAYGDKGMLQSVLENLLSNAWKFTGTHQTARIEFGATDHAPPPAGCPGGRPVGERAYFVRDDGAGFDMKYAHKLFGAFQRLHGLEEFPGSGIGLAIIQRIVHRHGGKVWAEGAVEKGATFYFTLGQQPEES
jgi:PAS domain S-box-containing protein